MIDARANPVRRSAIAFGLMLLAFHGFTQPTDAASKKAFVISAVDLAKNPNRYIGKMIKVPDLACYPDGGDTTRCSSMNGVDVVTTSIGPIGKLNFIDMRCDAGDSVKRTADCVVTLTFIPHSARLEDGFFIPKGKSDPGKIRVFQTDSARMSPK